MYEYLQCVLKLSAFGFCAWAKSLAPFMHLLVNNSLVKLVQSLHDSLTKIFNIMDLCFVHHFLHAYPYLIIDGIQIWAVRGHSVNFMKSGVSFVRSVTFCRALCARAPS